MKLSPLMRKAFREGKFVAVYVEGPKGPIPRKFGDNQGGWPLRIGMTRTYTDEITRQSNRCSPYHWQGVLFRVWVENDNAARGTKAAIEGLIQSKSAELKMTWRDMGPEFDLDMFEYECHVAAQGFGIKVYDEEGFMWLLRREAKRRSLKYATKECRVAG